MVVVSWNQPANSVAAPHAASLTAMYLLDEGIGRPRAVSASPEKLNEVLSHCFSYDQSINKLSINKYWRIITIKTTKSNKSVNKNYRRNYYRVFQEKLDELFRGKICELPQKLPIATWFTRAKCWKKRRLKRIFSDISTSHNPVKLLIIYSPYFIWY